MACVLLTHPEVDVDPAVPIERWSLSPAGRNRAARAAGRLPSVQRIVSSSETKAQDTAEIVAARLGLTASADAALGEMDRSSTGFVEPVLFESLVGEFFDHPGESVRGWERAVDAQRRVVEAVRLHSAHPAGSDTAFVSHGGVGALLMASLAGAAISREFDQPGLGSFFLFDSREWRLLDGWSRA